MFFFKSQKPNGLFYKISQNEQTSYLYASIHRGPADIHVLSDEVFHAFTAAKVVVFEEFIKTSEEMEQEQSKIRDRIFDWVFENQAASLAPEIKAKLAIIKQSHEDFTDLAPIESYHVFCEKIANKIELYRQLDQIKFEDHLKQRADELSIPCAGLENYSDAYCAFLGLGLTRQEQIEVVHHFLPTLDQTNIYEYFKNIVHTYLARDLERHVSYAFEKFSNPEGIPCVDKYFRLFVTERDILMASNMEPYLKEGEAFITIGAAHLPGVIKELSAKGYTVESIEEGPRTHPINSVQKRSGCDLL